MTKYYGKKSSDNGAEVALACLLILGGMVLLGLIIGALITVLWNALMPYLFGLPTIDIWQALGLYILLSILFGAGRYAFSKSN